MPQKYTGFLVTLVTFGNIMSKNSEDGSKKERKERKRREKKKRKQVKNGGF